jgi:hypothetical protein
VDRFNAWAKVHVAGRLLTPADRARYAEEIQRPDRRAYYDQMANDLTRARDAGARKPTRRS